MDDKERYKVQDMITGEYLDMNEEEIEKVKLFFQRKKDEKMKKDFLEYIELQGFELSKSSIRLELPLCEYIKILHYKKDNIELTFRENELNSMYSDKESRDYIFSELDNNSFDDFNSDIFLRLYNYG